MGIFYYFLPGGLPEKEEFDEEKEEDDEEKDDEEKKENYEKEKEMEVKRRTGWANSHWSPYHLPPSPGSPTTRFFLPSRS